MQLPSSTSTCCCHHDVFGFLWTFNLALTERHSAAGMLCYAARGEGEGIYERQKRSFFLSRGLGSGGGGSGSPGSALAELRLVSLSPSLCGRKWDSFRQSSQAAPGLQSERFDLLRLLFRNTAWPMAWPHVWNQTPEIRAAKTVLALLLPLLDFSALY